MACMPSYMQSTGVPSSIEKRGMSLKSSWRWMTNGRLTVSADDLPDCGRCGAIITTWPIGATSSASRCMPGACMLSSLVTSIRGLSPGRSVRNGMSVVCFIYANIVRFSV